MHSGGNARGSYHATSDNFFFPVAVSNTALMSNATIPTEKRKRKIVPR